MDWFYALLADIVMVLHFGFILFVLFGAFLFRSHPGMIWLHVPALAWAVVIEFSGGYCPLTPLENWLRLQSGRADYDAGFVEHYLGAIIYPAGFTPSVAIGLGIAVLTINIALYAWVLRARRDSG